MPRKDLRIEGYELLVGIIYHRKDVNSFSRRKLKEALGARKREIPSENEFRKYIPSYPIMNSFYHGAGICFHFFNGNSSVISEGLSKLVFYHACSIDNEGTMYVRRDVVDFIYSDLQKKLTPNQESQLAVLAYDLGPFLTSEPMPRKHIAERLKNKHNMTRKCLAQS